MTQLQISRYRADATKNFNCSYPGGSGPVENTMRSDEVKFDGLLRLGRAHFIEIAHPEQWQLFAIELVAALTFFGLAAVVRNVGSQAAAAALAICGFIIAITAVWEAVLVIRAAIKRSEI